MIYPLSGFASGIRDLPVWEERLRVCCLMEESLQPLSVWNPRMTARLCASLNSDKLEIWYRKKLELLVPTDEYAKQVASSKFKFSHDYPALGEML